MLNSEKDNGNSAVNDDNAMIESGSGGTDSEFEVMYNCREDVELFTAGFGPQDAIKYIDDILEM